MLQIIEAVLSQEKYPIWFAPTTLNNREGNYSATDKEFLALLDFHWKFKFYTNH